MPKNDSQHYKPEIDILSRNTTWTISRDTSVGLEFAPTVFTTVRHDGETSGIKGLKGLEGKSVCVQTGTTTEQNLADQMRNRCQVYAHRL